MTSSPITQALAQRLRTEPASAVAVVVEFSRPQDLDDLAALALARLGSTLASGTLAPAEIQGLAVRDDVLLIDAVPEAYPT